MVTAGEMVNTHPEFSIPSIVAVIAAVGSFFAGAGTGMLLAIIAIIAGGIGLLLSFAPAVRGGLVSLVSIVTGVLGILVAVLRIIF